jgi:hypothetical protein
MGHEVALLVAKAETMKHHGFDRMASGHNPHFWVVLRRLVDDLGAPAFFKHTCDKAQGISDQRAVWLWLRWDVRTVRWSHSLLL